MGNMIYLLCSGYFFGGGWFFPTKKRLKKKVLGKLTKTSGVFVCRWFWGQAMRFCVEDSPWQANAAWKKAGLRCPGFA